MSLDTGSALRIRAIGRRVHGVGMETYAAWREDRTHRLGAGLAFYALFTVVPLLALTGVLAGWLFGTTDVENYLADRLQQFEVVDAETSSAALTATLESSEVTSGLGLFGLGSLLFAASLFFLAFTDAINVIWKVPVGAGVWNTVRRRLIAFVMVLVTGGVLVAGLAVTAVAGAADAILPGDASVVGTLGDALMSLASWVSLTLALAMLFRFLTPVRVRWVGALVAGLVTALLLALGTVAISWYLRRFGGASVAGAFGSVLVVLTWIYYEAQILLGGVQLVKVMAGTHPDLLLDTSGAAEGRPSRHGAEDALTNPTSGLRE